MAELPDGIAEKIEVLSEQGNHFLDEESNWQEAIRVWEEALSLLPEPKEDWEACLWLYGSIGEAYFEGELYQKSLEQFQRAAELDDSNPFIQFRIGANLFELGKKDEAKIQFANAIDLGGEDLFEDEIEYRQLVKSKLKLH